MDSDVVKMEKLGSILRHQRQCGELNKMAKPTRMIGIESASRYVRARLC